MADFLIKNEQHWMDNPLVDLTERLKDERFKAKYDARYRVGDVVEVQEDNFWPDHATGRGKWRILRVPGLKKAEALKYMAALEDGDDIKRRRQYNVDISKVFGEKTVATIKSLTDISSDVYKYKVESDGTVTSDSLSVAG